MPHRYACLRIWRALNPCCSQTSLSSSSSVCPAKKSKTSTCVQHLCICVHCHLKLDGLVAAIYPSNIPVRASLRGYESMSQKKMSRIAWHGEEAIDERALTRGVFLCHSLDKVPAISFVVNTLFCHTSALLSITTPSFYLHFTAFVCLCILFCFCCTFGLCADFITLLLASLQPKDGLSSQTTAVHYRFPLLFPLPVWQDTQCSAAGVKVSCGMCMFSCLLFGRRNYFDALPRPPNQLPPRAVISRNKSHLPACKRSKQIKQERSRGRKGEHRDTSN